MIINRIIYVVTLRHTLDSILKFKVCIHVVDAEWICVVRKLVYIFLMVFTLTKQQAMIKPFTYLRLLFLMKKHGPPTSIFHSSQSWVILSSCLRLLSLLLTSASNSRFSVIWLCSSLFPFRITDKRLLRDTVWWFP